MTSIIPRFKRAVSVRELAEVFTPTPDEIAWERGKTQNQQHLLALLGLDRLDLAGLSNPFTSVSHVDGHQWFLM